MDSVSNQTSQVQQKPKLPLFAYSGLIFLALVYIFSMISFALGGDGLLIKLTSFGSLISMIAMIPVLIALRKLSLANSENKSRPSIFPIMFLTIYMGFSYIAARVLFEQWYVFPTLKNSVPVVAKNIQIVSGLFSNGYRIETDSGVFYIKDDLVVTDQEFNLQKRETKDGLLSKTYVCVADSCSGVQ